jgi:hypothetical protein
MPMKDTDLAKDIADALKADAPTDEIKALAKALVAIVKAGTFSHIAVEGTAPPTGGPLTGGNAKAGIILLPTEATLPAEIASALGGPPTAQITGLAIGFTTHMKIGLVEFEPGGITGSCGNTPAPAPGPFTGGGEGGKITGLDGGALASLWETALGGSSDQITAKANAVVDYFMNNADASYAQGTLVGVVAAGPIAVPGIGGQFK